MYDTKARKQLIETKLRIACLTEINANDLIVILLKNRSALRTCVYVASFLLCLKFTG